MPDVAPQKSGCLVCGNTDVYSRGLCQPHYRQFQKQLKSFATPEEAEAYEQQLLDEGWIEPKKKGGRPKSWSPFADIAAQVRAGEIPGVRTISEEELEAAEELAERDRQDLKEAAELAKRPVKKKATKKVAKRSTSIETKASKRKSG